MTHEQPTVLVIQNEPNGGPRRIATWLQEAGVAVQIVDAYADGIAVPDRLEYQGLLIMGGGLLPDEDERAHWLPATRRLAEQAIAARIPMLGICLGGQLLAHVAGGTVRGNHGLPEFGSTAIELRPEAQDDPLFGSLPTVVPAIEHHVDAITEVPPDVVWLGQSERCPYQIIRVGDRAWGTQFHPEATVENIRRWNADDVRAHGFDRDELIAQAEADDAASAAAWQEVIRRFAALVSN